MNTKETITVEDVEATLIPSFTDDAAGIAITDKPPQDLDPSGYTLQAKAREAIEYWYTPVKDEWDIENVPQEVVDRVAQALADYYATHRLTARLVPHENLLGRRDLIEIRRQYGDGPVLDVDTVWVEEDQTPQDALANSRYSDAEWVEPLTQTYTLEEAARALGMADGAALLDFDQSLNGDWDHMFSQAEVDQYRHILDNLDENGAYSESST